MKKTKWLETLKLWLGALLLLAESAAIGCKKLPKKAVALCVAAALVVAMVPVAVFAAETTYDIWVGGVQVTSANKDDITTAITEAGGTADGAAVHSNGALVVVHTGATFISSESGNSTVCAAVGQHKGCAAGHSNRSARETTGGAECVAVQAEVERFAICHRKGCRKLYVIGQVNVCRLVRIVWNGICTVPRSPLYVFTVGVDTLLLTADTVIGMGACRKR